MKGARDKNAKRKKTQKNPKMWVMERNEQFFSIKELYNKWECEILREFEPKPLLFHAGDIYSSKP